MHMVMEASIVALATFAASSPDLGRKVRSVAATLGLFSSMRAAKQATEALRDRLDTPLLCQGDDSTMLLVKRFAEDFLKRLAPADATKINS